MAAHSPAASGLPGCSPIYSKIVCSLVYNRRFCYRIFILNAKMHRKPRAERRPAGRHLRNSAFLSMKSIIICTKCIIACTNFIIFSLKFTIFDTYKVRHLKYKIHHFKYKVALRSAPLPRPRREFHPRSQRFPSRLTPSWPLHPPGRPKINILKYKLIILNTKIIIFDTRFIIYNEKLTCAPGGSANTFRNPSFLLQNPSFLVKTPSF